MKRILKLTLWLALTAVFALQCLNAQNCDCEDIEFKFRGYNCAESTFQIEFNGETVTGEGDDCGKYFETSWASTDIAPDTEYTLTSSDSCSHHIDLDFPACFDLYIDGAKSEGRSLDAGSGGQSWVIELKLKKPESGSPGGSGGVPEGGSFKWEVSLGTLQDGSTAGNLFLYGEVMNGTYYSPTSLQLSNNAETLDTVYASDGVTLRQIITQEVIADIVTTNSFGYEIRFYEFAQAGNQVAGVYQISGSPRVVWSLSNPDQSLTTQERLQITELRDGVSTTHQIHSDPASGEMVFHYYNNTYSQTRSEVIDPVAKTRVLTEITKDTHGSVLSKTVQTYQEFAWGEELVQQVEDPEGDNLVTTYTFNESVPTSGGYSRLNNVVYPDGSWVKYDYNDSGRVTHTYRPWLDAPATPDLATSTNSFLTWNTYEKDGLFETILSATEEQILGKIVSSTRYDYSNSNLNGEPVETKTTDDRLANGYVEKSVSVHYRSTASEHLSDRLVSTTSRDEITWSYQYEQGTWNKLTEVFTAGSGDALRIQKTQSTKTSPNGIAGKTLRETQIENIAGKVVQRISSVYNGTSYTEISVTRYKYDLYGNLVEQKVNDKLTYEATYADGMRQWSADQIGIETLYTYESAGRIKTETLPGISPEPDIVTTYSYDFGGRITSRERSAGNLTETQHFQYYGNGKIKSETNVHGARIDYTYSNAGMITTQTHPGGVQVITENYLDRQVKSVTGSGVVSRFYSYGVDAEGNRFTETRKGTVDSPRWERTYRNRKGRTVKHEQPAYDGSIRTSESFYNRVGQLIKVTASGLAPTLYKYDEMGSLAYAGLDVDQNNQLLLASSDRITKSEDYYSISGSTVEKVNRQSTFRIAGKPIPSLLSETRQELSALPPGLDSVTRIVDAHGVLVTKQQSIDRANKAYTNRILSTQMGRSIQQSYTNGRLRSANSPQVYLPTTYSYDPLGRQLQVNDPLTGTTTHQYTGSGQIQTITNDASINTATYTYYPATHQNAGAIQSLTDAATETTHYAYNPRGQLTARWGTNTYPLQNTYDTYGQKTQLRTYRTEGSTVDWSRPTWPANSGPGDSTKWIYQASTSLLTRKEHSDTNGTDYTYDTANRLLTRTSARGLATTYGYHTSSGDLLTVQYSDNTPGITYTYNRQGQQTRITDGSGSRNIESTIYGAISAESYTNGDLSNYQIERSFDHLGRPKALKLTDPTSSTLLHTQHSYDSTSRIATIAQGSLNIRHRYHPAGDVLTERSYEKNGTLIYKNDTSLDALGRIAAIQNTKGNGDVISHTSYHYDALNRRTKAIQKNDDYWSYNYNKRSEIISGKRHLAATSPQSGLQLEYSYDSIGNRLSASTGGSPSGTHLRHQSHTANPLNQYTNISTPGYLQITGEANPAANVTVNNQSTVRQGRHFHHELNVDNTTGPVYQNIDVEATRSAHTPMQTQGSLFLAPASHSPTYDPDGNLKVDARWSYTWNAENRLIAMQTHPAAYSAGTPRHKLEFAYDSQGRRFSKKAYTWDTSTHSYALESSYRYLYDGWNLIAQLDALNTPTPTVHSTYTWGQDLSGSPQGAGGVGGLLIVTDKTGSTYLPTYDSNGNVMGYFQTDTETLVAEFEYGPFGEITRSTGSKKDDFNFKFSTKYEDAETGFLYYGFRYYDPVTGRWLSRDPIAENGGLNLYGMVGNNPISRWDYLGLDWCDDVAAYLPTLLDGINEAIEFRDQVIRDNPSVDFGNILQATGDITTGLYGLSQTTSAVSMTNSGGTQLLLHDSRGLVTSTAGKTPLVFKGAGIVGAGFDVYTLSTSESKTDKVTAGTSLVLTGAATIPGTQTVTGPLLLGFSGGSFINEVVMEPLLYNDIARDTVNSLTEEINSAQEVYDKLNGQFSDKCGCFVGSN